MAQELLSPKQLAGQLHISVHTVYLWVQLKKIPHYKLGKLVKFDLQEIQEWLKSKRVEVLE